jgi:hypothetical protein
MNTKPNTSLLVEMGRIFIVVLWTQKNNWRHAARVSLAKDELKIIRVGAYNDSSN